MERKHNADGLQWLVDDATAMQFEDSSFDAIIDKGTMDALYCQKEASAKVASVSKMAKEMSRVLRPGCWAFIVSFGQPETRLKLLQTAELDWAEVQTEKIQVPGKPAHYMYSCQKKPQSAA